MLNQEPEEAKMAETESKKIEVPAIAARASLPEPAAPVKIDIGTVGPLTLP